MAHARPPKSGSRGAGAVVTIWSAAALACFQTAFSSTRRACDGRGPFASCGSVHLAGSTCAHSYHAPRRAGKPTRAALRGVPSRFGSGKEADAYSRSTFPVRMPVDTFLPVGELKRVLDARATGVVPLRRAGAPGDEQQGRGNQSILRCSNTRPTMAPELRPGGRTRCFRRVNRMFW